MWHSSAKKKVNFALLLLLPQSFTAPRENWRVFRSEISEPFSYYIFKPFSLDLRYVFRSLKLDRNSYWVPYDLRSSSRTNSVRTRPF